MRKIILLLPLIMLLFSSCHFMGGHQVRGNGKLSSQNRTLNNFDAVEVVGGMDVVLVPGPAHAVRVEADDNLMQYIETDRDRNTLVVRTRRGYNLNPSAGLKVYITAPQLREIGITGSGTVTSQSRLRYPGTVAIDITGSGDVRLELDAPEINAEATGSGNTALTGTTRNFRAAINGSGEFRCFNLLSENTDVEISGSGSAEVFASKKLDIEINGSGNVAYKGNPSVNQDISGSGDIRKVQ